MVAGISGPLSGVGARVFDLTAEFEGVDDGVCRAVYKDNDAAYLPGAGVCSGTGITDVCVVCEGGEYPIGPSGACGVCLSGEYPIGPSRACGVCLSGEYRHATSYTCDPCPADITECEALFGLGPWLLPRSLACGGLESGCVATPQCSPGYYGDVSDGGACVLCADHTVGSVQRGDPVPAGEIVSAVDGVTPDCVAVSGSGSVVALGFSGGSISGWRW